MRYCEKCGTEIAENQKFCSKCGNSIQDEGVFCPKCGTHYKQTPHFCSKCGENFEDQIGKSVSVGKLYLKDIGRILFENIRCLPSFILGLIGGIPGIFGGMCVSAYYDIMPFSNGNSALVLLVFGSIIGLVGACYCMSKARFGSLLMLISAIMAAICLYTKTGGGLSSIIGMLLMAIGGVIGLIQSRPRLR